MIKKSLKTLYAFVFLCIIWELLYLFSAGIGIPSILNTIQALIRNFPVLMRHLFASALRLLYGLSIAFIIGTLTGFIMAKVELIDTLLSPIVYVITPLPKVAFLPIVMVIFGISETARIIILVFVVIFQFIVASRDALKAMPKAYQVSMKSLNLSKKSQLIDILIPYSAPYLFSAIRSGFGMSIAVLFFIETFVNQVGIGYYIMNRWGMVNYPDMFSGILLLSIFGFVVYGCIDWLEQKTCPWRNISNKPKS